MLAAVVMAGAPSAIALFTAAQHFATLHTYTLAGDFFELVTRQVEEITSDVEVMSSGIRSEMTSTVTQESTHITGTGAEPSEPIELLSEGLWIVDVRFTDYVPPEVGNIPTVNLNRVDGSGSAGWSGRSWAHIYVTADKNWSEYIGFPRTIPTLRPARWCCTSPTYRPTSSGQPTLIGSVSCRMSGSNRSAHAAAGGSALNQRRCLPISAAMGRPSAASL